MQQFVTGCSFGRRETDDETTISSMVRCDKMRGGTASWTLRRGSADRNESVSELGTNSNEEGCIDCFISFQTILDRHFDTKNNNFCTNVN